MPFTFYEIKYYAGKPLPFMKLNIMLVIYNQVCFNIYSQDPHVTGVKSET